MGESIKITEPTLILSISVLYPDIEPDIYEATRYAWRLNTNSVKLYRLLLARCGDMVVGAFHPTKWMKATRENFADKTPSVEHPGEFEGRWGLRVTAARLTGTSMLGSGFQAVAADRTRSATANLSDTIS